MLPVTFGPALHALFPEKQEGNGTARIDSAVVDIFACCGALIPKDTQSTFRTSLEKLCRLALAQRIQSQRLRQRIEPILNPGAHSHWKLLPWLVSEKQSQKGPTGAKPGSASQSTAQDDTEGAAVLETNAVV